MQEHQPRDIVKPPARTLSNKSNHKSATPPPLSSPPSSIPASPATAPVVTHGKSNVATSGSQTNLNRNISQTQNSHSNSNLPNTSSNGVASSSPGQPPSGGRRSSFGLNFLSSFSSTARAPHQPPSPTESPHTFMSNSPTIANLNNYAMSTTLHDEAMANGRRFHPSGSELQSGSNTNSDSDIPANPANNPIQLQQNESSTDINNTTQVGLSNDSNNSNELNNLTNSDEDAHLVGSTTAAPFVLAPGAPHTTATERASDILDGVEDDKSNGLDKDGFFSVRLTPLIDHSSSASGLYFSPIIRKIKPGSNISIGRYTEKNKSAAHAPQGSSAPIVFKSKVVSRTHALFQCNDDGQWFLKDCKSSSGTFLNHIRLSPASQESTMMPLIDGDIIQLGMDYRGGTEEVYRCVKMRCEFNKSWQRKVNQFNLEIHKKLKNLQLNNDDQQKTDSTLTVTNPITGSTGTMEDLAECAICLMKIEPCQALFISPCSHAWHYKCIRPIIIKSYPQFYCPNCRTMCDLETDLDEDD